MENKKIGFIGLGIMGMAMAQNTKKAGFEVAATNRSKKKLDEALHLGLSVFSTPKELTENVDVVIIMVTGPKDVKEVLQGDNGVLAASNRDGKIIIQMSTIDENSTLEFAEMVQTRGMRFVDCPVAGSKKQVDAAELILLAGAETKVLKMVEPILKSMGKSIVHAGEIGKGSALKLCMNLIVAQMTTALCESVALARVQSIDPKFIFDVIKESPAINCGYFRIKESNLLNDSYEPAFSLNNMLKDVEFMDQAAKSKRLPLPVTQAVRFLMENARTEGFGDEDLTSMAKLLRPKINSGG